MDLQPLFLRRTERGVDPFPADTGLEAGDTPDNTQSVFEQTAWAKAGGSGSKKTPKVMVYS